MRDFCCEGWDKISTRRQILVSLVQMYINNVLAFIMLIYAVLFPDSLLMAGWTVYNISLAFLASARDCSLGYMSLDRYQ